MRKFFENIRSLDELKHSYKDLARRYHPDLGGDLETMQAINSEYDKMLEYFAKHGSRTEREKAAAEVPEKFRDIIAKLLTLPYIQIEIIGGWIWLSGNTALYLRKIQSLGFLYSKKQKRYYLPDETTGGRRGSRYTMDDIRNIYGSQIIDNPSRAKFLS